MTDKLLHDLLKEVRDDVKEIREAMPTMKADIDDLKTFRQRVYTFLGIAAVGGGGTGAGWWTGLFDALSKGQGVTH